MRAERYVIISPSLGISPHICLAIYHLFPRIWAVAISLIFYTTQHIMMRFIGRIFLLRIILHNIIISHRLWHFAYYSVHIMLETSASNTQASDMLYIFHTSSHAAQWRLHNIISILFVTAHSFVLKFMVSRHDNINHILVSSSAIFAQKLYYRMHGIWTFIRGLITVHSNHLTITIMYSPFFITFHIISCRFFGIFTSLIRT